MNYQNQSSQNTELYLNTKRIVANMLIGRQDNEAALYLVSSFDSKTVEQVCIDLKTMLPDELTESFFELIEVMKE